MTSIHQQLLNFADKELLTSISTDSIAVDGYEVVNLISKKRSFHHQSAFLCEHYMKCPVEVVLTFPCLIDISSVVIQPKASSHRTKEFEMYTTYQTPVVPDRSKVNKEPNETEIDNALYPCCYPNDYNDVEILKARALSCFSFAGKYKEQLGLDQTPDRLIFTGPSNKKLYDTKANDLLLNLKLVSCCSNLVIKIKWASVPAISSLQVWGRLSNKNPKYVSKELEKLLRKINKDRVVKISIKKSNKICTFPKNTHEQSLTNCLENVKNRNSTINGDIPEEFMDPITFFIMTVPMMLPSGNTIDKNTLEKYINEEEKYGRLPSDPFTGIVFHGSKTPIPNSSLKARIDDYLLKNTHLYKGGATSGYRDNRSSKTVDELKESLPSTSKAEKRKLEVTSDRCHKNNTSLPLTGNKHQDDMKSSLNLALEKVLPNLPTLNSRNENEKSRCLKCEDDEFKNLFKLPCSHIFCRNCMQVLLQTTKRCAKCDKAFGRFNVTKLTVT